MMSINRIPKANETDHEELAEGDVREDVVSLVLAAHGPTLLPKVRELVEQRPTRPQVQHILPRQGGIQKWVVQMGEQPGEGEGEKELNLPCYLDQHPAKVLVLECW